MNIRKLENAVRCLYGVAIIYSAIGIYGAAMVLNHFMQFAGDKSAALMEIHLSDFAGSLAWPALIIGASIVVAPHLRQQKSWAWMTALWIFLLALPSFCLPFSIYGGLRLLDREVRGRFIQELDFKI